MLSTWAKLYLPILRANEHLWVQARTKDDRLAALETTANKIVAQIDEDGDEHIQGLQKVSLYCPLCQCISPTLFRKLKIGLTTTRKTRRTLSFKQCKHKTMQKGLSKLRMYVIKHTHQKKIHACIAAKTKEKVGHNDWLCHYPGAVNEVMAGLTKEEMEQAKQEANDQMENGNPRDVQRK